MQTEEILRVAVNGIAFCESGGTLDDYLDYYLSKNAPRRTISSILFSYYRNKGVIDTLIGSSSNGRTKLHIRRVLCVVLTQILYQSAVPSGILADVAVSFVKKKEGKMASGFVNAIIRQFMKYKDNTLAENKTVDDSIRIPRILLERWKHNFCNEGVLCVLRAITAIPPFTFRTTLDNADITERLNCKKVEDLTFLKRFDFFSADEPKAILNSDLMKEGRLYVQDPASVLLGELIAGTEFKTVLDYCSAPGGKTLLLAKMFKNSQIVATDRSILRLNRVKENVERFGLKNVEVKKMNDFQNMPDSIFDLVLVDVPCSNTGVIRHRPDVMWNFTEKSLIGLVKLQSEILENACTKVKPGGYLIYSTCSIEPEENQEQIKHFTAKHSEFTIEKLKLLLPSVLNDGAFVAILKYQKSASQAN